MKLFSSLESHNAAPRPTPQNAPRRYVSRRFLVVVIELDQGIRSLHLKMGRFGLFAVFPRFDHVVVGENQLQCNQPTGSGRRPLGSGWQDDRLPILKKRNQHLANLLAFFEDSETKQLLMLLKPSVISPFSSFFA
jgi:hypothetical protein